MDRADKTLLLRAACNISPPHRFIRLRNEVSIRQEASFTPAGWAKAWHLDLAGVEGQRSSSIRPFHVYAFEIKSCFADFATDKKWMNYIDRVDCLTFLSFPGVIDPAKLKGTDAGLRTLEIKCYDHGNCYRVRWNCEVDNRISEIGEVERYDAMYGLAICQPDKRDWEAIFRELAVRYQREEQERTEPPGSSAK